MEAREELRKLRLKLTDKRNKDDKEDMMMFQTITTKPALQRWWIMITKRNI